MKKNIFLIVFSFLIIVFMANLSFAYEGKGNSKKDGFEGKFFNIVRKVYQNKDELKFTDEQMKKIKEIKVALKKELIKKKADIEIIMVDIKAEMYEEDINVKALNQLIDKKYDLKKDKAKTLVDAYSQLNKVFTKEQKELLKNIKCPKKM